MEKPQNGNTHYQFKQESKQSEQSNLDIILACDYPDIYSPPDELLQGILTTGATSVLYGDSNCGKTFLAIDIACAISRGSLWMNRRTESGLVIYIAAESPGSVQRRLQVYQQFHDVRLSNFAVIRSPVDLFIDDRDTIHIIDEVRRLEDEMGQKAQLIVGDTLARLSAGGDENSGKDMGKVIKHSDLIHKECLAHFMFVHHCGKDVAKGLRGWSGVRAAIDTEIEITATAEGRCAKITKQRDLDSNGLKIGFRLETIVMGKTKWGDNATSCVVHEDDVPVVAKKEYKRRGKIKECILTYMRDFDNFIDKTSTVNCVLRLLNEKKKKSETPSLFTSVYKELRELIDEGQVVESNGLIRLI